MTDFERGFHVGFACACAITISNYDEPTIVGETYRCNFMSVAQLRKIGVQEADIELLKPVIVEIERKYKLYKTQYHETKHT